MSRTPAKELLHLDLLLQLLNRAQQAQDLPALRFTMVNETHALVPYRQALQFEPAAGQRKLKLVCASGLTSVAEDSPFAVWVTQFAQRLPQDGQIHCIDHAGAAEIDQPGWAEWLPEHLLLLPIMGPQNRTLGMTLYVRETPWSDHDVALLTRAHEGFGYCLSALHNSTGRTRLGRLGSGWRTGRLHWWVLAVLAVLLFLPVRMSVLAPAEVVALSATAVPAPQDGVIGSFGIEPNSAVKAGDVLFSLDDTVLTNQRQVALQALEIARADEHTARQRAFDEVKGRADLALMMGRTREKEAELAAIDALTRRVEVRAERDGIAIFSDVNDWLGRPVQTGERVMRLAQPTDVGVLVWLAVADAINPTAGAPVQMFLHTDPLSPRSAQLFEASYQATLSPEDVASYRLRAHFEPGQELPRIGLRGTARISGEWVSLGYYLFRRPLAALREWTGL